MMNAKHQRCKKYSKSVKFPYLVGHGIQNKHIPTSLNASSPTEKHLFSEWWRNEIIEKYVCLEISLFVNRVIGFCCKSHVVLGQSFYHLFKINRTCKLLLVFMHVFCLFWKCVTKFDEESIRFWCLLGVLWNRCKNLWRFNSCNTWCSRYIGFFKLLRACICKLCNINGNFVYRAVVAPCVRRGLHKQKVKKRWNEIDRTWWPASLVKVSMCFSQASIRVIPASSRTLYHPALIGKMGSLSYN